MFFLYKLDFTLGPDKQFVQSSFSSDEKINGNLMKCEIVYIYVLKSIIIKI